MSVLSFIIGWSLRNRGIVVLLTLFFVLFGIRAAMTLPVDAVPDLTTVQVQVVTSAPALSPVEIEKYVTIPVERALSGIPKSTEIRSISKYGISLVTVVFRDDTNIYFARQMVAERMQRPVIERYGTPELAPITTGLGEVYQFVVKNPALTAMQREELLDRTIAPQLRTVPGVVEANSLGGENRQYEVLIDPLRLQAAGMSVADVIGALQKSNANAGGGYIERNGEHYVIGSDGLVRNIDDLRSVVVGATPDGFPITLATVADVTFAPRLRRGAASMDGKGEVVVGMALMLTGENSREVTQAIKQKLDALLPSLPPGTTIEPFYDRTVLVDHTISTVAKNLLEGALLVIAVLFLLIGDIRAGLVVAATIPLSLLFALILMNALGLSGNLMSLGAIDFGMIVDGAVIVVENAVRRLSIPSDKPRLRVIEEAAIEVRTASIFGEAIVAIVYLPLLTLSGIEGKLFRPMATTVLFALLGALLLSLTVVPVLTSYWVKPGAHPDTWLLSRTRRAFSRLQRQGRVITAVAAVAFVTAITLFATMGAEFIPQLDEGDILIESKAIPGTALTKTLQLQERLQRAVLGVAEVSHVVSKIGAPELALDPMGIEAADVYISLKDRSQWRPGLTKAALAADIQAAAESSVPELQLAMSQPIQMRTNELVAGVKSDVALFFYGDDLDQLKSLASAAHDALAKVEGIADLRLQQVAGLKYLRIVPDRNRLARYGLTIADINRLTETIAVGYPAGVVLENEKRFDIVVKTATADEGIIEPLKALPLKSVNGQIVPLGDVAELRFTDGPAEVQRSHGSRRLAVEMNVRGRDVVSAVRDAQAAIARHVVVPVGYRAEWGGQHEHYEDAKLRLLFVVPLALSLIAIMLWLATRSLLLSSLIFLNVPFAMTGGVFALALRGIPFSISAGVGFIALFGVAVLNGLVLLSFAQKLRQEGDSHHLAIQKAVQLRLRPVLMTALVASLGFLPMALSQAPGSEVQRPLATVVIGGILSATLLTLFVLPIVYERLSRSIRRQ